MMLFDYEELQACSRNETWFNAKAVSGTHLYFATYLLAYNSISVSWETNYLSAAELIPTEARAKVTAILNIVTRIGNIAAARTVGKFKGHWEPGIMITILCSNIFSFIITFMFLRVSSATKNSCSP
ncbi:hypothetical protein COOONC_19240 [Cooperia oncophora]